MVYGIEIYNDSNVIQFSSEQSNFFFVQKGSVSALPAPGYPTSERPSARCVIAPSVDYDAIAVYCTTVMIVPQGIYPSTQAGGTPKTFYMDTPGGTVYWWAFRSHRTLTPRTSGYGLEIYNADGAVAFSDTQPQIMRYFGKVPVSTTSTINVSVPTSGVTLAFLEYGVSQCFRSRTWKDPEGPGNITRRIEHRTACRWTSGNVAVDANAISTSLVNTTTKLNSFNGGVLMLDVTGY